MISKRYPLWMISVVLLNELLIVWKSTQINANQVRKYSLKQIIFIHCKKSLLHKVSQNGSNS
jgi:hypothetical protein